MDDPETAARAVLAANRRDGYTIPSPELYPYQWNWDSAFIAVGLSTFDAEAATTELRSLFEGLWPNGLLPHILFRDETAAGYFPGPAEWDVRADGLATSGITQPPVAVSAARTVFERTGDEAFLDAVLPAARAHLAWWREERSFDGDLVYVRHPWETGMDDSPAWDGPLSAIDPGSPEYTREDRSSDDAARERPTDWYYDRYVHLLRQGRALDWREARLREACPFLVEDVLTNSAFVRACDDLAALLDAVGEPDAAADWRSQAESSRARMRRRLWDDDLGLFVSYDRAADRPLRVQSVAGLLPVWAGVPDRRQTDTLLETIREQFLGHRFGVPTYVGDDADPDRYWRGPVWTNTNWLLERGLRRLDETLGGPESTDSGSAATLADRAASLADRIREDTLALVEDRGFREYFDPRTGEGRGSDRFSWSAALSLDWTAGTGRRR